MQQCPDAADLAAEDDFWQRLAVTLAAGAGIAMNVMLLEYSSLKL
ncbi:hypothetical protein [Arcanobacterium hippocoleae]